MAICEFLGVRQGQPPCTVYRSLVDLDDVDAARLQSPDSQLPYGSEGGNILGMGRDPTKNQTPDLFSTERLGGPSSDRPADAVTGRPPRRTALPKDLPKAIRHLEDRELDWLLRVATEETKRRGRAMPMAEASPHKHACRLVRANSCAD